MDKEKIEKRLKEIDDEVRLLSEYVGESVEKRLVKHLDGVKVVMETIQESSSQSEIPSEAYTQISDGMLQLKTDLDTLLTTFENNRRNDLDGLIERIGKNAGTLVDGVSSIDAAVINADKKADGRFDSLNEQLITGFEVLKTSSESLTMLLTVNENETLSGLVEKVDAAVASSGDKADERFGTLDAQLVAGFETLKSSSESLTSLFTVDENETLAGLVGKIDAGTKKIISELPDISVRVGDGIGALKNTLRDGVSQLDRGTADSRETLLKELRALSENAEVIRRMCATDDEKFLGSMATTIFNHVNRMNEELPKVAVNIKNWFVTLDKKVQASSDDINSRQDEMKKLLLYDLGKISEGTDVLKSMCTTTDERPLGGEMLMVSDRVGSILEDVGDIQYKVTRMADQLDRVSAEVVRMRWFVIAAVTASIVVLATSFIL